MRQYERVLRVMGRMQPSPPVKSSGPIVEAAADDSRLAAEDRAAAKEARDAAQTSGH